MSPMGKKIVSAILLVVGVAMLAFTACGLFFGVVGFEQPGGIGVALMGLACAGIGAALMYGIFKTWRSLWPLPRPADSTAQKLPAASDDERP